MKTSSASGANLAGTAEGPVFRAEVVGSLLRPTELTKASEQHELRQLTDEQLEQAQAAAIRDALAMQAECGLEVCTDGEMRRHHFADPLLSGLSCFGSAAGAHEPWRDSAGKARTSGDARAVTSKLDFSGSDEASAFLFTASAASLPVKVTVPSPTYLLSRWVPQVSAEAYPDPFDLFRDTAEILTEIVRSLVEAGCRYIQFDAPELTAVVDKAASAQLEERGIAPERLVETACELMDSITAQVGSETKFAVHLCRGNLRGLWRKSGGYEALSETFFTQVRGVDTFMLEFDDDRSGTFECLDRLPADKVAVLGLITTKRGELDDASTIVERVRSAAEFVPLDRLAISTQCGFASTAEGNPITPEQQRQKLELVANIARSVWGPRPAEEQLKQAGF